MKSCEQSPCSATPYSPYRLEVSKDISFDVNCKSLNRALFLVRYFLTKSLVRGEKLEISESAVLTLLVEKLLSSRDSRFIEKNLMKFLSIRLLFKIWNSKDPLTEDQKVTIRLIQKNQELFLSPRAFLGQDLSLGNYLRRYNRLLRRKPRPPAYIGVGYRDKGSARDLALDGSPSWQECFAGLPETVRNQSETVEYLTIPLGSNGRAIWYPLGAQVHTRLSSNLL